MADDLLRFREGRPIVARPASTVARLMKWSKRHPAIAGLASAIVVIVSLSLVSVTGLWLRAEREADAARYSQGIAETNATRADDANHAAETRRRAAELRGAELAFDRGRIECERGQPAHGLLWIVRALELSESAGATHLERPIRVALADWSRDIYQPSRTVQQNGTVRTMAYRPDGKVLAAAGDSSVQFWDVESGQEWAAPIRVLPVVWVKSFAIRSVAWSPDGMRIATGSDDGRAQVFEVATRKRIAVFPIAGADVVWRAEFSLSGQELLTCSDNGQIQRWNIATGKPIGPPLQVGTLGGFWNMAVSPDRRLLATGGRDNEVRLWKVPSFEPIGEPIVRFVRPTALAFSADSDRLFIGSNEGSAFIYTIATRALEALPRTTHPYRDVVSAPDGSSFAIASGYRLTHADSETALSIGGSIIGNSPIIAVAYAPDRRVIAAGDERGRIQFYTLPASRSVGPAMPHPRGEITLRLAFERDGQTLLSATRLGVTRWNTLTGQRVSSRELFHQTKLLSAAFSRDGKWLGTGAYFGYFDLYDLNSWTRSGFDERYLSEGVDVVAWLADGRRLIMFSPNSTRSFLGPRGSWIWDVPSGKKPSRRVLSKLDVPIRAAVALPGNNLVALACDDGELRIWDVDADQQVGAGFHHGEAVTAVEISSDGERIFTGCRDGSARLWSRTGQLLIAPMRHDEEVTSVAISPDGATLFTGSADRSARFWDAATGLPLGAPLRHDSPVTAVTFRPDGKQVATGTRRPATHVWSVPLDERRGSVAELREWARKLTGLALGENGIVQTGSR